MWSSGNQRPVPPWLPSPIREWVIDYGELLDAVFERFDRTGEWPAATQLQRELFADGRDAGLLSALDRLPRALGNVDHHPDRVVLSLFGLGCVPAAHTLLEHYVSVLQLALERFGKPTLPSRVSREDVEQRLGLSAEEADRLSHLVLADSPFLGGGDAGLHNWDLGIRRQVVNYRDADTPGTFLARLAAERALDRQPNPWGPMMSIAPAGPPDRTSHPNRVRRRLWHPMGRAARWVAGSVLIAGLAAYLIPKVVSALDDVEGAVTGRELISVDVERDPTRFDSNMEFDWERYDYVVDRAPDEIPAPPKGTCRERFAWAQRLGGRDAYRSKLRVYLRGKMEEPVIVEGFEVKAHRSPAPRSGTHVACPVGGALLNPLMIYVNLDRPSARYGRMDEPPKRFLFTLEHRKVVSLEVQAQTTRYDAEWWLELKVRAGDERSVLRVDDDGEPFRTVAPPRRSIAWDGRRWAPRPDLRQRAPLPP